MMLREWDGGDADLSRAADLYAEVFSEPPYGDDPATSRESFIERATRYARTKPAFRLLLAEDDDLMVGLVLGIGTDHGDWWRDRVAEAVDAETRRSWLAAECFFVDELAVSQPYRRQGVAARLMEQVLAALPYDTALLTCYAEADATRRFYAAQGWSEIVCGFRVGSSPELCLLARRTP